MLLLPSAEFSFEINCFKNISFRSTGRVSNSMDLDNAWHFSLIRVKAVDKVYQANIRCTWIKLCHLFAFKKNSTIFNLRIGVFSHFVIFKFNVDPRFALSNQLPILINSYPTSDIC